MPMSDFTGNHNNGTNNGSNGNNMPPGVPLSAIASGPQSDATDVESLLINYNEKFKTAGGVMFRDNVIQQTMATLIALNKPNPLLIGGAGVGKTKIAEAIAYELANDTALVPQALKGYTIYELPLSNIVAGSSLVGQLESKIQSVIDYVTDPKKKAILFIDEIHQLVSERSTYQQIAQILKPALARNDLKVIGATTLQEVNNFMNDPALNRRFSRIIVDELSRPQTIEILKTMKGKFFTHYNNRVTISDAVIEQCAEIADFYVNVGSHRPDNAITLLDRALGEAVIKRHVMEQQAQSDPVMLQALQASPIISLSEKQLRITALRLMTGNNEKTEFEPDELKQAFSVIKGQDEVIETIVRKINEKNKLPDDPEDEKPLVFMFAGTSGVGKTEVARILAKTLTQTKPIKLNMAEYHSSASINRIIGSPSGYVGSDSNAELPFDILESNPYQVILLDEFEKCDISVQRFFMGAFEEGKMKTNRGKEINFTKAIFIATTNAGFKERKSTLGFTQQENEHISTAELTAILSNWFDPELLNRIQSNGAILGFNEITKDAFTTILLQTYEKEAARLKKANRKLKITDTLDDVTLHKLVDENFIPAFGARPVKGIVKHHIAEQAL